MQDVLQPFMIEDVLFTPQAYLLLVDEPDFGCEGAPDGKPVCGSIRWVNAHGEHVTPIPETQLFATRLDDKMWIGEWKGEIVLVTRRKQVLTMNDAEQQWREANAAVS